MSDGLLARVQRIARPDDPRTAGYRDLRDADFKVRGRFVAEGAEVLRTLVEHGRFAIESVLIAEGRLPALSVALDRLPTAVPIYAAPLEALSAIVGFDLHRGVLALGVRGEPEGGTALLERLGQRPRSAVVVLEGLANHDNVGGVFRNARALGADAVFLDDRSADPLYRKAIRVSMGAALTVPFARLEPWPDALGDLEAAGYTVAALTPRAGAQDLGELIVTRALPARVALLLGTEGSGLSEAALARAGAHWRIPMAAGTDSLNVAAASAIALFVLANGAVGAAPLR